LGEWYKSRHRRIVLDFHTPSWPDNVLANIDPENIVKKFHQAGINAATIYAKCQHGFSYYNTKIGTKHPALGKRDLLREFLHYLNIYDIKSIVYFTTTLSENDAKNNKQWLSVDINGKHGFQIFGAETDSTLKGHYLLCINSGFRQFMLSQIKEIYENYSFDGFFVDMLTYIFTGDAICFCMNCSNKFKSDTGLDLPQKIDWENRLFKKWVSWRYEKIKEYGLQIRNYCKALNKNISFCANYHGSPGTPGQYQSWLLGQKACDGKLFSDYILAETYPNVFGYHYASFLTNFCRNLNDGKSFEALTYRFCNHWDWSLKPKNQLAYEVFSAAINKGDASVVDQPYHDGTLENSVYENIKDIYKVIQKRENIIFNEKNENLKFAALLYSQNTFTYYCKDDLDKYILGFLGAYNLLIENHIPVDIISEENLTNNQNGNKLFKKYKTIILSNCACISERTFNLLMDYCSNGGELILSYHSGTYDEEGVYKENNPFEKSLGFKISINEQYPYDYYRFTDNKFNINYDARPILTYKGIPEITVDDRNIVIIAQTVHPVGNSRKGFTYSNNLIPPNILVEAGPAIITKKFNKGEIVYIAPDIFQDYYQFGFIEIKEIVKKLLINDIKPEVEVEAISTVEVQVLKNEKNKKYYVNILNFHNNKPVVRSVNKPYCSMPAIEGILPTNEILIKFNKNSVKKYKCHGKMFVERLNNSTLKAKINELWGILEVDYF